jgi:hypothetical protein
MGNVLIKKEKMQCEQICDSSEMRKDILDFDSDWAIGYIQEESPHQEHDTYY